MEKLLLGIDFGTSTNFISKYDFRKKEAVPVANMGEHTKGEIFKNCIYIETEENYTIGSSNKSLKDPKNYFENIKVLLESDWSVKVPNYGNKEMTAKDLIQLIFKKIKEKVENNENRKIDGVVLTVPYEYSDKYKRRLKEAAMKAGLKVINTLEEPVAVAISYGLLENNLKANEEETILVFDLGGGTFDLTIFNLKKGENLENQIEVLNTGGIEKLGGEKIDEIIEKKLLENLEIELHEIENEKYRMQLQRMLRNKAVEVKEELSYSSEIDIYEIVDINGNQSELELEITKSEFNNWLKENDILSQIEEALDNLFIGANISRRKIDRIVLAGGSSNIPIVKETIEKYFGKKPDASKKLGELVGLGAGVFAGLTEDQELKYKIIRKTNHHIGINKGDKFFQILDKNMPYEKKSTKRAFKVSNPNESNRINIYKGIENITEITKAKKIGEIKVDLDKYVENILKISLMKDENGKFVYFLYNKINELIDKDYIIEI